VLTIISADCAPAPGCVVQKGRGPALTHADSLDVPDSTSMRRINKRKSSLSFDITADAALAGSLWST